MRIPFKKWLGREEPPQGEPLPVYMDPVEWSQVLAILETLQPKRVLEWGSGGSTRAILAECPFIERYVSVEHNRGWHARVAELVTDPRLSLNLVEGTEQEPRFPKGTKGSSKIIAAWYLKCETDPSIMADYVAMPATLGEQFDLVLVDGRSRNQCLKAGWELLADGGVLLIHDAQRTEYHETIGSFPRARFFEPWHQGQVCLMRK
jgi:predicted O-methyltransferase YrrM